MAWSKLVDLELTDEDKLDAILPMPMETPDYPCGLCICLTETEVEKLGLDFDCDVGDMVDIRAFAVVTCVNKSDGPNGPRGRVELQIQKMAVENEMTEEAPEPEESAEPEHDEPTRRMGSSYGADRSPATASPLGPAKSRAAPLKRRAALYTKPGGPRGSNWDQDLA